MQNEYICIRECYYGPPGARKHFKVGDMLPSNWEPNKHFIKGKIVPQEEPNQPPKVPGDDPRSTSMIIRDLYMKHGIDMKGKTRKEVFTVWLEAEHNKEEKRTKIATGATESAETTREPSGDSKDPLNGKRFSDMTPDEINDAYRDNIVDAINKRFKLDMTHMGKSKIELIQMGIDLESKQTGAKAI